MLGRAISQGTLTVEIKLSIIDVPIDYGVPEVNSYIETTSDGLLVLGHSWANYDRMGPHVVLFIGLA